MAYELTDIQKIVEQVVEVIKGTEKKQEKFWDWLEDRVNIVKPKAKLPEFYEEYCVIVKQAERIRIHAEPGLFPDELFIKRSPNMLQKEFDYIKANFKQSSLTVFIDLINTISRSFADGNWSIDYGKENEDFQEYLETGIIRTNSLENYVKSLVPTLMMIEAMGVLAVDVPSFELKYDAEGNPAVDEETGGYIVDQSKPLNPQPYFYPSKNVLAYKQKEFYLLLMDEKTIVQVGDRNVRQGLKFAFFDKDNIWHISQIGKYEDYKFDYQLRIQHNWNRVPVEHMGGVPKIINNKLLFVSPFLYTTDLLDTVLLDTCNLFISKSKCVYPYRISVGDVCEFKDSTGNQCIEGMIYDTKNDKHYTCPSCFGLGLKSRISPAGELLLKPKSREQTGDELTADESMKFVAPDVTTLEFLRSEIKENITKSKQILHIYESKTEVKTQDNITATGMVIDQKAMYAFIKPISDQMFARYEFLIDAIGYIRYSSAYKKPTLYYPSTFDFLTEQDYLLAIAEAIKIGMPPAVVETKIKAYLQSIYYSEEKTARTFKLIDAADRLLAISNDDIDFKLSKGLADKWESVLHDSGIYLINKLLLEDDKFFEKELKDQIIALEDAAKDLASSIVQEQPAETTTGEVVNDIINQA